MIFLMKEARSRNTGTQGKLNSLSALQSPRPPRVEGITRWCDRSTGSGAWLTTVPFRSLRRLLPGPCFSEVRSGAWPLGPSCLGQRWAWAQRLRFPRPLLMLFHLSPHPQRRLGEEEEDGPGFCPSSVALLLSLFPHLCGPLWVTVRVRGDGAWCLPGTPRLASAAAA